MLSDKGGLCESVLTVEKRAAYDRGEDSNEPQGQGNPFSGGFPGGFTFFQTSDGQGFTKTFHGSFPGGFSGGFPGGFPGGFSGGFPGGFSGGFPGGGAKGKKKTSEHR